MMQLRALLKTTRGKLAVLNTNCPQKTAKCTRTGKAHALNDAWFRVKDSLLTRNVDFFNKAVVVVIDADGIPAKNFTEVCAGPELLGDPRVGVIQVEVRMKNRDDEPPEKGSPAGSKVFGKRTMKLLVRMQDIEFHQSISAMQISCKYVGTERSRWQRAVNMRICIGISCRRERPLKRCNYLKILNLACI